MYSIHWLPHHRDASDKEYFAWLKPKFVKIVWSGANVPYVADLPPGTALIYRDVTLENVDLRLQPDLIGQAHALDMAAAVYNIRAAGFSGPVLVEGLNEPRVWTPEEAPHLVAEYYRAFLDTVHTWGGHAVVGNFGVGWPANTGPDTPPDWAFFQPVFDAMQPGDYLGLHEYWWNDGLDPMWLWWAGRCLQCPAQVPILITECGVDSYVADMRGERHGWHGLPGRTMDDRADKFCADLWDYMGRLAQDGRVAAVLPFTYDHGDREWERFNTDDDVFKAAFARKLQREPLPVPVPWLPQPQPPAEPPSEPAPAPYTLIDLTQPAGQLARHAWRTYPTRSLGFVDRVVLHYSWVTPPQADVAHEVIQIRSISRGHVARGWPAIGYHFIVGPSGAVYRVNAPETVAFHAGDHNERSLGVCCLLREGQPTPAQVTACAQLLLDLAYPEYLHKELVATGCPGQFLGPLVREAMNALREPDEPDPEPDPDPDPDPDLPPVAITYTRGGPYIVGDYPEPNRVLTLCDPWGNCTHQAAGAKPEYSQPPHRPNGGGFLFTASGIVVHHLSDGEHDWEIPMQRDKTARVTWL